MNTFQVKQISFEEYLYYLGISDAKSNKEKQSHNKNYLKGYRDGRK